MAPNTAQFEELFLPHLDAANNLARHLTGDEQEAEDVVQDAYLRAFRHFHMFRGENPRGWILMIVRRAAYTRWRQRRQERDAVSFDEEFHSDAAAADGPEEHLARQSAIELVQGALAGLAPMFREILVLRELEDLSYREISRITRVPVGTVMSRLSRARERLLAALPPTLLRRT